MAFLVRIKPSSPCKEFNEFKKDKGWYEVDKAKADWCRTRLLHDLHSEAPHVFDVVTKEEAKIVERLELKVVNPAGTVDAPVKLAPSEVTVDGDKPDDKDSKKASAEKAKPVVTG